MKHKCLKTLLLLFIPIAAISQNSLPVKDSTDTVQKVNTPRPYKEIITAKAITRDGLFKIHHINNRYFFEVGDSLLNKDILIVNRIEQAAAGARSAGFGDVGDEISQSVIQFFKGPNNKLFIRRVLYTPWANYSSDSSENGLYRAVRRSSLQSIVAGFDIKAFSPDSLGVVIDMTDYLNSDNDLFFFDSYSKANLTIANLQKDKSYIVNIQSYPMNVEIHTMKTFTQNYGNFLTYELNSSIVLLPRDPMKPRSVDARVGYFSVEHPNDYDVDPQGVSNVSFITRWRLEPKPEDIEKYNRGELVAPQKPIIFYIDPETPKKWVPYLIQGVNDWQPAFEQAGFKNAVYALEAPTADSTWSLEDARHSAIVYKPSNVKNASGPNVHDPRTGEIIESHINWYHNVMRLIHDWYFIQAGAIDPRARKITFDDSLMGQLIRFVSSHEVGHTLGLTHNFGASSTVAVDSLRNKRWVEANGICPSIMDYARFNYVAQPEDSISEKGIFPRIGVYDKWAIEWGYRIFPGIRNDQEEKLLMDKWVIEELRSNKYLWFGSERLTYDPRCQSEDLGDDAVKAGKYGIENLKRVESNLVKWLYRPADDYSTVARLQDGIVTQFERYLSHAANNVGGVTRTEKTMDEGGKVMGFTPKYKQRMAIKFLQEEIFTTPYWIMNKNLFELMGRGGVYQVADIQEKILTKLLNDDTFKRLLFYQDNDSINAYTPDELLTDLESGIWSELKSLRPINLYRQNLQEMYIIQLIALRKPPEKDQSLAHLFNQRTVIPAVIESHIRGLLSDIDRALPRFRDPSSKIHLKYLGDKVKSVLNHDN